MKRMPCFECEGEGEVQDEESDDMLVCSECDGTGEVEVEEDD